MLLDALKSVMEAIPADTAIMFSGGLDSGVLAAVAKQYYTPTLYTVGVENAHDLVAGRTGAEEVGLPWVGIVLTAEEIIEACCQLLRIADLSPVEVSFELPLQIIASRVKEANLLSGQGADELFGGYNRYAEMSAAELEQAFTRDYQHLVDNTLPKENAIAAAYHKTLHRPFLAPEVAAIALAMPPAQKIAAGVNKMPLRQLAAELNLTTIAVKEKKAAQYGSGIMKVLKAAAKKNQLSVGEYLSVLKKENL
ncbi:asparagine synthase C-terminal domain-containing protein [Candidatus Methanomassiliicoccus intestinalis]|uniref:asparagine synthase C-terminal domain-containing protein n=1 Tax=Candidatus Methanomassiliicoccus intestinalis TaxID=1406512 RepID=UPI0037DCDB41